MGTTLAVVTSGVLAGGVPFGIGPLVNGDFDSDLSGWINLYSRPAAWDPRDADDDPASGSALISNDSPVGNGGTSLVLSQCFAVSGAETIAFGGHLLLPTGQPVGTSAAVMVWAYAADDCLVDFLELSAVGLYEPGDDWQTVEQEFVLPSQARTIRLSMGVSKPQGATVDTSAYFDRLYLVMNDDTLFGNGFEL